ncbi:hypothetical protein [Clostridium sp.]|uniref:hypothetical protein n=1 Tax=Clostridium sp. TaxID=1506 RepID=UPI003D6D92B3
MSKIVLWIILVVPWLTLFFLKKEQVKHFMPVGILASFLMVLYNLIAYNEKYWIIKVHILPWLQPSFEAFVLGGFLVTTIWIFHFTFQRFWIYLITNIVLDFMFAIFPLPYLLQNKLGIYQLVNTTPWKRYFIFVIFSIIIYGYQKWEEEVFKPI